MIPLPAVALPLGLGLVAFWAWGLLGGGLTRGPEPWPGFRDHELSFAAPDLLLGAALLLAAALHGPQPQLARALALGGAGALAFLGALDAAYLWRTWALRPAAMRARTAAVVAACALGGAALAAAAS